MGERRGWEGRKEKEGRMEGRGKGKGGEGKGERMWRGPESGLPRGPCWLSAGLGINDLLNLSVRVCDSSNVFAWRSLFTVFKSRL